MQAVYIIRHGEPDFEEKKICLGKLDLELSKEGKTKCRELSRVLDGIPDGRFYSSPLKRCIQTANAAGISTMEIRSGFEELDMGLWDGLTFDVIREMWPKEYEERGKSFSKFTPPNGETLRQCKKRVSREFDNCIKSNPIGNPVIFTHNAAAKMLLSELFKIDENEIFRQPFEYCGIIQILINDGKAVSWVMSGIDKSDFLNANCLCVLKEYGTPANVIKHCEAVEGLSTFICDKLEKNGICLNKEFTKKCALLHDIARNKSHHAKEGAKILLKKGFGAAAAVVYDHMELPYEEERISEKSVVFLADKLIKETKRVSLEERYFSDITDEKRPYVQKKYLQAQRIQKLIGEYVPDVLE